VISRVQQTQIKRCRTSANMHFMESVTQTQQVKHPNQASLISLANAAVCSTPPYLHTIQFTRASFHSQFPHPCSAKDLRFMSTLTTWNCRVNKDKLLPTDARAACPPKDFWGRRGKQGYNRLGLLCRPVANDNDSAEQHTALDIAVVVVVEQFWDRHQPRCLP
jgi:hypothetical protein